MAASYDHIPWCFPYIEGCVSISKASRAVPEVHIYRFAITASAVMMVMYWVLCGQWLRLLQQQCTNTGEQAKPLPKYMVFVYVGVIASICLAINAALMGDSEGILRNVRRESVRVFFIGTVLAQCLFGYALFKFVKQNKLTGLTKLSKYKAIICLCQLTFALGFASLEPLIEDKEKMINMVNMVEWNIVLLIIAFFILTGICWNKTRFNASTMLVNLNNSG